MDLLTLHTKSLHQLAENVPGGPDGWTLHRMIFRDWWHWKKHELMAALGNIALIGQNEGGKSAILALAATLLDGDTSPRRLDPSQTPDRYLHYFLLGKDTDDVEDPNVFAHKARVGYVFLEFRRKRDGRHITIGMGLDASRNVQGRIREWWGFVIPDLRLGHDFDVWDREGRCLGFTAFRAHEAFGRVVDGEGDVPPGSIVLTTKRHIYRMQVNSHLFKMSDDDYRALVETLVQARRPKIVQAAQDGPEKVCGLLRDSLPTVPPEAIESLSAVITNLEMQKRDLEALTDQTTKVEKLAELHLGLVQAVTQQAASEYSSANGRYGNFNGRLGAAAQQKKAAEERIRNLNDAVIGYTTLHLKSEAELKAQQVDVGSLPERLLQAQEHQKAAHHNYQAIGNHLEQLRQEIQNAEAVIRRIDEEFQTERRRLAMRLKNHVSNARSVGWPKAPAILQAGEEDLYSLDLTNQLDQVEAVKPDLNYLIDDGRKLLSHCRDAARRQQEWREKEIQHQEKLSVLNEYRQKWTQAVEALLDATAALEGEKERLAEAIKQWQDDYPGLQLRDHHVAGVRAAVMHLQAVPTDGHVELIGPIVEQVAVREQQLTAEREAILEQLADVQQKAKKVAEQITRLKQDGLRPLRTELREKARSQAHMQGHQPLYEWLRFRQDVDPRTATCVEAALVEAGILDLLIGPNHVAPAGDAWAWVGTQCPPQSLLNVLEPELDAPASVGAVLATIGWGKGQGDHWVTQDGTWCHGLAGGQVASWVEEPYGLVGQKRRAGILAERIERLQIEQTALNTRKHETQQELERYGEALASARKAVSRLHTGLGWQTLFTAFHNLAEAQKRATGTEAEVLVAKEPEAAARRALEEAYGRYQEALQKAPMARELEEGSLNQMIEAFDDLVGQIKGLPSTYESLERHMKEYQRAQEQRNQKQGSETTWKDQHQKAEDEWEVARVALVALKQRVDHPDMAAALAARERLVVIIEECKMKEKQAREDGAGALQQKTQAETQMAEIKPQVDQAIATRNEKKGALIDKLRLHPDYVSIADTLEAEREHRVNLPQGLPRPVENADELPDAIQQRRSDLMEYYLKVADDLVDYRPTPDKAYDRIVFFDEDRQELSPPALLSRMEQKQENVRGMINEEERNLYEEIICNDLLDDLIDLTARATDFTQTTNRKLKDLKASSGAYFSFRFSIREETDKVHVPGVGVAHALKELDRGVKWLTGEQRRHLARMIRDEVERMTARSKADDKPIGYLEAVEGTLDYRQWYEFRLFNHTPGSPKPEEIKTRGFGVRSMFGRTWALAVPIIAGVAARYDAAQDPDVPRLIFLDEIFAGFDPKNQATYLRYLRDLDLCWFITCPDDPPYGPELPAVMSYQMQLSGRVHTAYPSLWDGQRVTDPYEVLGGHSIREVAAGRDPVEASE